MYINTHVQLDPRARLGFGLYPQQCSVNSCLAPRLLYDPRCQSCSLSLVTLAADGEAWRTVTME